MKNAKLLILALLALPLTGCYYMPRSLDSYHSTFRPVAPEPNRADPYSFGGISEGSGGTQTRTSYATDSKSTDPRSATETGKKAMFDDDRVPQPAEQFNVRVTSKPVGTAPVSHADMDPQKGSPLTAPPAR
jgi:hypothetical protein